MVSEVKIKEMRDNAAAGLRQVLQKHGAVMGEIQQLENALRAKQLERAQLENAAVEAQSSLQSFNLALGDETPIQEFLNPPAKDDPKAPVDIASRRKPRAQTPPPAQA